MGAIPLSINKPVGLAGIRASAAYQKLLDAGLKERFEKVARVGDVAEIEHFAGEPGLTAQDLRLYVASREAEIAANPVPVIAPPAGNVPTVGANVTLPALRTAVRAARESLFGYLANRSKGFRGCVYGPTLDGTYFYRLGSRGTHGYGMKKEQLDEAQDHLCKQGFPRLQLEELRLINYLSYQARRAGSKDNGKDARYCVKHFPGGDERVELTEMNPVSYTDPQSIGQWLTMFADVIGSDDPPAYVMLSHARYAREPFIPQGVAPQVRAKAAERLETNWLLEGSPFEEIPASLNPAIVRYLREELGFRGTIVGDWYNMGAIEQFVEPIAKKLDLAPKLVTTMLAVYAGVDAVPGAYVSKGDLEVLRARYPKRYQELVEIVDASLIERFHRMGGSRELDVDLSSMDAYQKLYLIREGETWGEVNEPDDRALVELLETRDYDEGSGDIWNRTGVMTLLMRQKIVENLTGRTFAAPPRKSSDEERWFDELTRDPAFRAIYDAIRWDDPAVLRVFSAQAAEVIGKTKPVA